MEQLDGQVHRTFAAASKDIPARGIPRVLGTQTNREAMLGTCSGHAGPCTTV